MKVPYENTNEIQAILNNKDLSTKEKAVKIRAKLYDIACRTTNWIVPPIVGAEVIETILKEREA